MSDSDTEPSQSPSITQDQGMGHAEGIVRSWSDYEVVGLKILRGEPTVEDIVCGITRQFFNENNQLKPGVFWSDLFSNKVIPNHTQTRKLEISYTITKTLRERLFPYLNGFKGTRRVTESLLTSPCRTMLSATYTNFKSLCYQPLCRDWVLIRISFGLRSLA